MGPSSQISLLGSYAYHIPVTGHSKLAIGASGGVTQYTLDFSNLQVKVNPDPAIMGGGKITAIQPTINVGAWYYSMNYYIGVSANQLLLKTITSNPQAITHLLIRGLVVFILTIFFRLVIDLTLLITGR
jgi:type IX secretion system PorP/SprF family membrane protein